MAVSFELSRESRQAGNPNCAEAENCLAETLPLFRQKFVLTVQKPDFQVAFIVFFTGCVVIVA